MHLDYTLLTKQTNKFVMYICQSHINETGQTSRYNLLLTIYIYLILFK